MSYFSQDQDPRPDKNHPKGEKIILFPDTIYLVWAGATPSWVKKQRQEHAWTQLAFSFFFFSNRCLCVWYVCLHVYTCACHVCMCVCVWDQSLALGAFLNHFLPSVWGRISWHLLIWFLWLTSLLGAGITGRLPHPPTFMWVLRVWTRRMINVTIKRNHHSCTFEILLLRNLVPALTVCRLSLLGFSMCRII